MSTTRHGDGHSPPPAGSPFGFRTLAMIAFGAILLFFLLAEHRAHLSGALPFLLLLLCPLLHLFMHGGHGGPEDATGSADRRSGQDGTAHRH